MEANLVAWIMKMLGRGFKVTQKDIRKRARYETNKDGRLSCFAASKGWMEKFFGRYPSIYKEISERNKSHLSEVESSDSGEDRR